MKNICFLLGDFQQNGGISRVVSVLVKRLCKETEYQFHTLVYAQDRRAPLYEIPSVVRNHVLFNRTLPMANAILFEHAIGRVKKVLKQNKIDVLIACGTLYFPLAILAAKSAKTKVICWEHTNPATNCDHRFQRIARKYAVKKAKDIVVLTKTAERYYQEQLGCCQEKLHQIYNPIAPDACKSGRYDLEAKKIISVGRLSYPKNFHLLIRVAAEVLRKHPEWTWDIYGEGEDHSSLQESIIAHNLIGRVNLLGQVGDLYERYGEYSFLVMTSRYEGFPMALVEGMANKLPLVSFDISTGPNEIIQDNINGFLIPEGDETEMISCICQLIEKDNLRQGFSKATEELQTRYDIESIVSQWKELL